MRKSRLFLAFVGSLFLTSVFAQVEFDVKLGLNNSSVGVNGISESIMPTTSGKTTLSIGSDVSYQLDNHFSIGTGAHYNRMGFFVKEGTAFNLAGIDIPLGVELQVVENEINIPLFLKYTYPTQWANFYAKAGPSISIGTGGTYKTVATSIINFTLDERGIGYSDSSLFNRNSINMDMGLGATFPYGSGHIIAEIGMRRGMTDKIESDLLDTKVTYNSMNFKVGYGLKF